VDVDEYSAFLDRGFQVVFHDFINRDKIQLPNEWKKTIKNVKAITALPESRVLDCIASIFSDKIKADKVDKEKGTELDNLAQFTVEWFEMKYGSGAGMKRQLKGFVKGLTNLVNDDSAETHDYAMLFGQMAGMWTESERFVHWCLKMKACSITPLTFPFSKLLSTGSNLCQQELRRTCFLR
jgi:hypothetical protein